MHKTTILLGCLCLASHFAEAQRRTQSSELTYSIEKNEPGQAQNLSIYLAPAYVELYKPNSDVSLGYGAGFNFRLPGDKIFLEAHMRNAYIDRWDEGGTNASELSGSPVNGTRSSLGWGGTATYNFLVRDEEKKYDVTIRSTSRVRYFTLIPGTVRKMMGLRLGADHYTNEYKFDRGISGTIADRDTSPSKTYTSDAQGFFTMQKVTTLNVGISRTLLYDLDCLLNFREQLGMKRGVHYSSTLYFDFVYAPSIQFDNIYVPLSYDFSSNGYGAWYNYHLVDISGMKKQTMGFKLGWQQYSTKKFGSTIGVEFGSRPGIAGTSFGDNLYLLFKFAFSFSTSIGK
jgi:hypothetical protein